MTKDFADKTVVVTGGASGIGAATARAFAQRGARVLIADRQPADPVIDAIVQAGGTASAIVVDLAEADACRAVIDTAIDLYGALDILIHNAGFGIPGTVDSLSVDDLDAVWAVNFRAGFLLAKHAVPVMRAGNGGVLLFTTAAAGHAGQANLLSYSTSKAALINLVRTLALDHARDGIRVNAISPGPTATPMEAGARAAFGIPPEAIVALMPLGVIAQPEEIAEGFIYLASPGARSITGQILAIDGGMLAGPFLPTRGGELGRQAPG